MIYLGIDPGISGGIAAITDSRQVIYAQAFSTIWDMRDLLERKSQEIDAKAVAIIERVHSMPKQGVASTFKFGENFGEWQGLLAGRYIPFEFATPAKWQKDLGCLSHGDKNVTKARAQQIFPQIRVTHAIADALLLAEYCRRAWAK